MCSPTLEMTCSERWRRATLSKVCGRRLFQTPHAVLSHVPCNQPGSSGLYFVATEKRQCYVQHWSGSIWGAGLDARQWIKAAFFTLKVLRDREKLGTILEVFSLKNEENTVTTSPWPKVRHREEDSPYSGSLLVTFCDASDILRAEPGSVSEAA